jgi:large subunit ribosomal protein L24
MASDREDRKHRGVIMREFSLAWKSSKKPSKQRKYRFMAPLHLRKKMMRVHLATDLSKKHKMRNISVRKGDKVRVIKGDYKKMEGKVERVDAKNYRLFVTGVERSKKDGTKALVPIAPANLIIIELNTEDKRRLAEQKETAKGGKN